MKLVKLKYRTIIDNDWELDDLSLNPKINLIVAQNATGKTKTINAIAFLSRLLKEYFGDNLFPLSDLECIFNINDRHSLKYSFKTIFTNNGQNLDPKVSFIEKLHYDKKLVLSRKGDEAEIYSMKLKEYVKISPPSNKLVIQVRRDKIEYPFFEDLIDWANGLRLFEFSSVSPIMFKKTESSDIGKLLNKLPDEQKKSVIDNLNTIGYQIEDIRTLKLNENDFVVILREKNIQKDIFESQISQGQIRALAILVFIEYSFHFNNISTIIVDDLGEGLDYERATKLGKLLVEKLESSKIQFIATTNDSFLMDVIPIKYWNVLHREGNVVKSFNYQNSKELFDNFAFTGLSNFDLFSSDYLLQKT